MKRIDSKVNVFVLTFLLLAMASICILDFASSQSISVQEPQNKVYLENTIPIVFTYNLPTYDRASVALESFSYSLDQKPEVYFVPSIDGSSCKTAISGLSEGNHTLIVYVNYGITGSIPFNYYNRVTVRSHLIEFAVKDSTVPKIQVLSINPISIITFNGSEVPLVFSISERTSWMGYNVDNESAITIAGNTTLTELPEGLHSLIVYANDTWGNMGKSYTSYFIIASQTPTTFISTISSSPSPSPTVQPTITPSTTSNPTFSPIPSPSPTPATSDLATPSPTPTDLAEPLGTYWVAAALVATFLAATVLAAILLRRKHK